ncbi:MAG TPA: hypothetical protein PLB97_06815 [Accumulibacter sp.]|nr:hypothetical protein [Accumulibacter sp.]
MANTDDITGSIGCSSSRDLTAAEIEMIAGGMGMCGQRIVSGLLTGGGAALGALGGPIGVALGAAAGAALAYSILS